MPYLATVAVKALPQPQGTTVPNVLTAKQVALGSGPNGETLLSVTLQKGATLTYRLEPEQAAGLLTGLQKAAADTKNGAAPKTTVGKTAKPKK